MIISDKRISQIIDENCRVGYWSSESAPSLFEVKSAIKQAIDEERKAIFARLEKEWPYFLDKWWES